MMLKYVKKCQNNQLLPFLIQDDFFVIKIKVWMHNTILMSASLIAPLNAGTIRKGCGGWCKCQCVCKVNSEGRRVFEPAQAVIYTPLRSDARSREGWDECEK